MSSKDCFKLIYTGVSAAAVGTTAVPNALAFMLEGDIVRLGAVAVAGSGPPVAAASRFLVDRSRALSFRWLARANCR